MWYNVLEWDQSSSSCRTRLGRACVVVTQWALVEIQLSLLLLLLLLLLRLSLSKLIYHPPPYTSRSSVCKGGSNYAVQPASDFLKPRKKDGHDL
jgi:hypothetical protein